MSKRFASGNLGDIIARGSVETDAAYVDVPLERSFAPDDMDRLAANLAGAFAARYERGQRVAIIARNGSCFLLSYLGLMRAGLVAVPISFRQPVDTVHYILKDAECVAALIDADFVDMVPELLPTIELDSDEFEGLQQHAPIAPVRMKTGELCEVLYTSGSTGIPKGVPLDHHGQLWALEKFLDTMGEQLERTAIVAPAYHMNGLFFSTVSLALGWRAYSLGGFDTRALLQLVADEKITVMSGIPTMFAMMARESDLIVRLDLSSVKSVVIGSAPLTQALIDRVSEIFPAAEVRNSYGTTESGPAMFGPHPGGLPRPALAIGYPYEGVECKLVDGSENEGRLLTRTPAVFSSYLNLPEVTASKIRDGWYDTGDIVRTDENGWFYYVGRADDMFVCGGENIFPGEVEKLLERHAAVLQAAVLPVEDTIKGAIPIAFVAPNEGQEIDPEDVKRFTLENGPAYAHPRAVVVMDRLPVGGTHKVDRKALEGPAREAARQLARA